MRIVQLEKDENIALLKLNNGVTNAINPQLVRELLEDLMIARNDPDIGGIVLLSSNDKFFSIGLDIPYLFHLGEAEFKVFLQSFDRLCLELYTLPKPTVAAVTGHATAGGCILAVCCDYLVVAEGRKLMGLNEVKLGIPVPYPADCILRHEIGTRNARAILETGDLLLPEKLHGIGVVDEVVPIENVRLNAVERARYLASLPSESFSILKRNRVEMAVARIYERMEEKEQLFVKCWFSDYARRLLKEAIEKF